MYVEVFTAPLDVDWDEDGEELLEHMWAALAERAPEAQSHAFLVHHPTPDEPAFYFGYKANSGPLTSELTFLPTDAGMRVFVGIHNEADVPAQVQPWSDAIIEATKRLNAGHPEFAWEAAIGPVGRQLRGVQRLQEGGTVAGLEVGAATTLFRDVQPSHEVPQFNAFRAEVSYPLVVRGSDRSFNWRRAAPKAAERLNRLCALLSVAFDANWRLQHTPYLEETGHLAVPPARFPELFNPPNTNYQTEDVTLPDWLASAWQRCEAEGDLATALHAHHQALAMEPMFPSHALIGYVSVVEGLGARLADLTRCAHCGSSTGAGRRFRAGLAVALPADEYALCVSAYGNRSTTAHAGRLHGGEATTGAISSMPLFGPQPASVTFRHQSLWRMRKASRELLHRALRGDLGSAAATE